MSTPTPSRYVHVVDDVPELVGARPVMLASLEGFLDAGNAAVLAVDHLLSTGQGRVVATFDIDAFYDYRARRPEMSFVEDHYQDYKTPRLVVRLLTDQADRPYLLMHGPEPDTHWEAFTQAVRHVLEHFEVAMVVSLGSVPMAVPHTRPVLVTNHATRSDLLTQTNIWQGELRIPSSAMAVLQVRLREWGIDGAGYVAHVPHYIAQMDHPAASLKLLESIEGLTGLQWSLSALATAAASREGEIADQISDSEEVAAVVSGLEQQYDAMSRGEQQGGLPLAEDRDLPTADELGDEFERFLAELDPDDD